MAFQVTDEALAKLDSLDDAGKRTVLAKLSAEERAQIAAAVPTWKSKRSGGVLGGAGGDPIPNREDSNAMDPAKAIAVKLMPFPAVTRRTSAAIDAGLTKGQQLLVSLGLMDPPPDEHVSDEIDRAPVRINGKVAVKGQYVPDSGPMPTPDPSFADLYRQRYDQNLALEQQAQREQPELSTAASITSAVLTPLPKVGKLGEGAGLLSKAAFAGKQGAAAGAIFGAGNSEADLQRGEYGKLLAETGIGGVGGGVLGGGFGLAGGAGSKLLSAIRNRATRGANDAVAAEKAIQEALASKNIASAKGSLGSAAQSASRDIEVLIREAAELPVGNPQGDAARAFLASAEGMALREGLVSSKLASAPDRMAEMGQKRATLDALTAGKDANVTAQTAEALKNPVKKHVTPRLLTLGHRLLPPALAAVGGIVGGTEGAIAGGAVGGIMSLTQGLPGRILKNLAQKPAVRKAFWEGAFKAAGVAENSGAIKALEMAADKGPQAFAATAGNLIQSNPELANVLQVLQAGGPVTNDQRTKAIASKLREMP